MPAHTNEKKIYRWIISDDNNNVNNDEDSDNFEDEHDYNIDKYTWYELTCLECIESGNFLLV